jgi:aspartate 4-decarboxylase
MLDLDFHRERAYSRQFVERINQNTKPSESLFQLASEARVVLLPGLGFGTQHRSRRISLANLNESDYRKSALDATVGPSNRHLLWEVVRLAVLQLSLTLAFELIASRVSAFVVN